jgi:hypothetical protein
MRLAAVISFACHKALAHQTEVVQIVSVKISFFFACLWSLCFTRSISGILPSNEEYTNSHTRFSWSAAEAGESAEMANELSADSTLAITGPKLSIAYTRATCTVSWPLSGKDWVLEEALLPQTVSWIAISPNSYQSNAVSQYMMVATTAGNRFFVCAGLIPLQAV